MRDSSRAAPSVTSFSSNGINPSEDICPVCKSNRYLNPSLQFLINPECYHKMCSTCVDRIFSSGPASCPVPYCGKTLRKRGFHKAFFGDLQVEREVDIRKRVGEVFNRRQDEFETLLDWNNYLEEVETLVFDLVEGTREDKARAEEKLRQYREGNKGEIEENKRLGQEEAEMIRLKEKAEQDAVRQRRLQELKEEEEEKMDLERSRRAALEQMANSNEDANKIAKQLSRVILKKTSGRRNVMDNKPTESTTAPSLTIRGLKKKVAPMPEKPYDPFGGLDLTPTRYTLQGDYDNEWLETAKADIRHMAGGYSLQEYYARTMFEAFSGLGVFVEDETANRPQPSMHPMTAAQPALEAAANKVKLEQKIDSDDIF
ncbi:CDK-activating kinase assembly factor MAT1-domain-containing protein [Xylogone sp. PMI_703]|nr:CDK-activating kinase assembly factor MAT1-domain-containing protein [Xylogone sp. PMI_703]